MVQKNLPPSIFDITRRIQNLDISRGKAGHREARPGMAGHGGQGKTRRRDEAGQDGGTEERCIQETIFDFEPQVSQVLEILSEAQTEEMLRM